MSTSPAPQTVLVMNAGSSSLKFAVVSVSPSAGEAGDVGAVHAATGSVAAIGPDAVLSITMGGETVARDERVITSHAEAARWVLEALAAASGATSRGVASLPPFDAVGHRVVHGGESCADTVRIDDEVVNAIEQATELAPLHNAASLDTITTARQVLGDEVPMVAVFDTTFFRDMPASASTYAIPRDVAARHRIRRYGFHGTAHASLAAGYAKAAGRRLEDVRLVTLHLGNGCSATAIGGGRALDTSMGFTPLEGLVMGTRAGDLDPAIVSYLARHEPGGVQYVDRMLNEQSGLLGVSGLSHDMRTLLAAADQRHDPHAALAVEMFCYRARKYLGAYLAVLGGADAVVFGGGIGEHAPDIRSRICAGMDWCGVRLDVERNITAVNLAPGEGARISPAGARVDVYVVAVDEASWIARDTVRCLRRTGARNT